MTKPRKPYPSETQARFIVRFPDEKMRDMISDAAKANNRSMNAEIVARLQATFSKEDLVRSTLGIPANTLPSDWEELFRKVIREEIAPQMKKLSKG